MSTSKLYLYYTDIINTFISKNPITLRTPFVVKEFDSVDHFIKTVFPNIVSYLQKCMSQGIQKAELEVIVYSELEKHFRLFIVQNYTKDLDEYIDREARHAGKEAMKDLLLSTISITLSVSDESSRKLSENDYLISLRGIIDNFGL